MTRLDPNRPIYPHAPLNLVICAIEFSLSPSLQTQTGLETVFRDLREDFPITASLAQEVKVGPAGAESVMPNVFHDRNRTRTLTVSPTSVGIETSDYRRFEDFLDLVMKSIETVNRIAEIPSLQRVGLRYIDEITVREAETIEDWSEFIEEDLLAPGRFFSTEFETSEYRAANQFNCGDGHSLTMRFGLTHEAAVNPTGTLKIKNPPEGRYFLLDLDSSWRAPTGEFPEFEASVLRDILERSHTPIRTVFEGAIKSSLKARFMGEKR